MRVMDCREPASWGPALDEAVHVLGRGGLVVVPTDTVYGLAAEAFTPGAVAALAAVTRKPARVAPAVLVPQTRTVDGLCTDVPDGARALLAAFWPGRLTLVLRAQPSLAWDLGDDGLTVAVRMPDHPAALALLRRTGPLAVTGAHGAGESPPRRVEDVLLGAGGAQLVLDAGELPRAERSTVLDATGAVPRLLRAGAIGLDELRTVTDVLDLDGCSGTDAPTPDVPTSDAPAAADPAPAADAVPAPAPEQVPGTKPVPGPEPLRGAEP